MNFQTQHSAAFRHLIAVMIMSVAMLRAEVTLQDGIQSRLSKLTETRSPGMAVLVARDGRIIYQGGFGWADLEKNTPVTAETKFRIGSVSKHFTAAAILRLAEDGKLAVIDPLEKFFPGFPKGVTLHQLLTHTSGIRSYTDKPDFMSKVNQPVTPADLIASFQNDPPDFAPGKGFHYNNSAYFLLGEIVAKVSGKTFAAYLQDTFFGPLGMKDSGIYQNSAPPAGMAAGYSMTGGKAAPALDWDMSWAGGAGAIYSTVGDLFLWNEALFGGKVLKATSFKEMTTPVKLPDGVDGMNYGYGLVMADVNRLPAITHGGGLNGWSSDLVRLPDQHCTVIALANALPPVAGYEPSAVTRQIAGKFLEADIKKLPPIQEDPSVDKTIYPDFAGRYDYKNAVLTISAENDHLYAQLTGQPKFQIHPKSATEFEWRVVKASVTFKKDGDGKVTGVTHTQNGQSFDAQKIK